MLLYEKNIDWNEYDSGKKYGRIIHKTQALKETPNGKCIRNIWVVNNAIPFEECKEIIQDYIYGQKESSETD